MHIGDLRVIVVLHRGRRGLFASQSDKLSAALRHRCFRALCPRDGGKYSLDVWYNLGVAKRYRLADDILGTNCNGVHVFLQLRTLPLGRVGEVWGRQ